MANPVLVEVERSGFVESRHRGVVSGLDADGARRIRLGATELPIFPRSANKPFQAAAMVRHGLDLRDEMLALAAASHSGENFHADGVRRILTGAGLGPDALGCPPAWPMDTEVAYGLIRQGSTRDRLRMNCSGKHAAMLRTCVLNGWPTETYLSPDHPLQLAIQETIEELTGEKTAATGVDGCGAPLYALTPAGVAQGFRNLVLAPPGSAERRVAEAMRVHPGWTSGTRRDERVLMEAIPGLLLKCGAEGVDAFAFADGRAGCVKIDDGAVRARTPVTVALLRALGLDAPVLAELGAGAVHGGNAVVGRIRLAAGLADALPG